MDAYADRHEALSHHDATLVVLGVLLPTFMGSLDQTILANALPTIGRDFNDIHNLPWLITAYLLASTAVMPLYGKIADIHGRRFSLRLAILAYMAGSFVCALAPNMMVLIFGRVLHGIGGGGLSSLGMIVLGDLVSPKERGRYYGYFSATYTSAGGLGPLLGGFISDHLHWSVIFWNRESLVRSRKSFAKVLSPSSVILQFRLRVLRFGKPPFAKISYFLSVKF